MYSKIQCLNGGRTMNIWSLLALAVGLSADAFAAAFVSGTGDRTNHIRSGILTSALFGIFQALMPVLGWSIGKAGSLMASWAEYTAASIILCFLGIKLIYRKEFSVPLKAAFRNPSSHVRPQQGLPWSFRFRNLPTLTGQFRY